MSSRLIALLFFIFAWGLLGQNSIFYYFFSNPLKTFIYFYNHIDSLIIAFFVTSSEAVFGLLIAIILAYLLGIVCLYQPKIEKLLNGFFVVTQVLPIITLAPLFIIFFGMGIGAKIAMVVLMSFFPVFVALLNGIHRVRNDKDDYLKVYSAKISYRIMKVYLPLSFPTTISGIKVATTMSVLGAVVAEFFGSNNGLGRNLYVAPKNSMAELMMASAILVAIMGTCMFRIVTLIEKTFLKWEK